MLPSRSGFLLVARRAALFALFAVVGAFAGLAIHEIVGHALPAYLFGARGLTITLNPDFTGEVSFDSNVLDGWRRSVVDAGGIAVNLVTGAIAIALASRAGRARQLVLLFGAISVYKALEYATMSFYYGGPGDPLEHADFCTLWHPKGYWALPLALLPFAMFACGRVFVRMEASLLTAVIVAAPTLLLGGAFYYRASVFGDGMRSMAARVEARARVCGLDASRAHVPFPMLPLVALAAGGGALAGGWSAARRSRQSVSVMKTLNGSST